MNPLKKYLLNFVQSWEHPKWAMLYALIIFTLLAAIRGPLWETSPNPYFNYLADAFLHGQAHLRLLPVKTHDLVFYNDQYYLYWPPLPAILMIPFVALFGVGFSDILFTLAIGVINVGLVACLLRRACTQSIISISGLQRALLVILFTLGTVHTILAPLGGVWYTGQVTAFGFTALAFLIPLSTHGWKAFLLTGLAVACAMLSRTHLIFIGIWPAYYLWTQHKTAGFKKVVQYAAVSALPLVIGLIVFFGYNYWRFGNILEIGHSSQIMTPFLQEDNLRYGSFNTHYIPINFYYQYIFYPLPPRSNSTMGGSLFLLSPVFFGAFWGLARSQPRASILFLVITILAIDLPILMFNGTGWEQFGPRYSLDFMIPLLLLTATGIRYWSTNILALLTLISTAHYLGGMFIVLKAAGKL